MIGGRGGERSNLFDLQTRLNGPESGDNCQCFKQCLKSLDLRSLDVSFLLYCDDIFVPVVLGYSTLTDLNESWSRTGSLVRSETEICFIMEPSPLGSSWLSRLPTRQRSVSGPTVRRVSTRVNQSYFRLVLPACWHVFIHFSATKHFAIQDLNELWGLGDHLTNIDISACVRRCRKHRKPMQLAKQF